MRSPLGEPVEVDRLDPTPWSTGLLVAALTAALTAVAVVGFGAALARVHPLLAVGINLIVFGGAIPTVWRWRKARTVRWVIYGLGVGVAAGWLGLLVYVLS